MAMAFPAEENFTVTFTEKFNASGKCISLQLNTVNHRKAIEVILIGISGFSLEEIYIQLQTSLSITSLTFLITLPNKSCLLNGMTWLLLLILMPLN